MDTSWLLRSLLLGNILKVTPERTFSQMLIILNFYLNSDQNCLRNVIFNGVARDRTLLLRATLQVLPSYYLKVSLICFSNTNYTIYQLFQQEKIIFKCFSRKVCEWLTQKIVKNGVNCGLLLFPWNTENSSDQQMRYNLWQLKDQ